MKIKLLAIASVLALITACSPKVSQPEEPITVDETLTPELAEGKNLYNNNCAGCHKLYNPKDFKLPSTADDWYKKGKYPWVPNWVHSGFPKNIEKAKIDKEDEKRVLEHTWRVVTKDTGRRKVVTNIIDSKGRNRQISLGNFLMYSSIGFM